MHSATSFFESVVCASTHFKTSSTALSCTACNGATTLLSAAGGTAIADTSKFDTCSTDGTSAVLTGLTCKTGYAPGGSGSTASAPYFGCFAATGVTWLKKANAAATQTLVICASNYFKTSAGDTSCTACNRASTLLAASGIGIVGAD